LRRTHKALKEFTSWVKLTGSEILELAVGTEVLRIHNVTEEDLVRKPYCETKGPCYDPYLGLKITRKTISFSLMVFWCQFQVQ
jgi:hypothetical protein